MKLKSSSIATLTFTLIFFAVFILKYEANISTGDLAYQYEVGVAFPNLSFSSPIGIYNARDGSNRLFVVEQQGIIRVFENTKNTTTANVFLDISNKVINSGELGLLGLAFHPNFTSNGYFYVYYTSDNPLRSVFSRFTVSANNPNEANVTSEFILLQVLQPFTNHNGGQIAFGPDNYLYIALGDGGGAGDPLGNAQNRSTLLGSILRIDVDSSSGGLNYSIPNDNPFVGNVQGYREEIFAYGLRNPWRFSFDPVTGWLWAADVGQNRIEEIDIIEKGNNYGWNIMEGSLCYSPPSGCNQTGLELPIWEYNHSLGFSVTGGFVYRGLKLNELKGAYIYGDYGSGRIWALWYNGTGEPVNVELVDTSLSIPSFGVDEMGEVYICAFDGKIYQLNVVDIVAPEIGVPYHTPLEPLPNQEVKVDVNVTDVASGVREVILSYRSDTLWTNVTMILVGGDTYTGNITAMPYQTQVEYRIIAHDNADNTAVNDNLGLFYTYTVIPEFPSTQIITVLMASTLIATFFSCKKRPKKSS
ncbi:PQQ-dependent sugar dehydrogenase [Candidatus Bathyarchaeota archaeon]|nr:PQQ-dependent sugar dehydrogenase [Candidatus Bathyarchaeota archaeon]